MSNKLLLRGQNFPLLHFFPDRKGFKKVSFSAEYLKTFFQASNKDKLSLLSYKAKDIIKTTSFVLSRTLEEYLPANFRFLKLLFSKKIAGIAACFLSLSFSRGNPKTQTHTHTHFHT